VDAQAFMYITEIIEAAGKGFTWRSANEAKKESGVGRAG
jgi:hypothetical protein